ncbi:hypothetical protein ACIQOU_09550 [Streptomyces sp. NPDC091279]|uniref:hypothetical protein n=1 Tax=unclassified Streptomyces TaxID=2593676 RepID=UPI0038245FA7
MAPEDDASPTASPTAPSATATPSDEAAVPRDPGASDGPVDQNASQPDVANEPVLRLLPLGSGLVLIGLGLALAFLGLRLRRG